MDKLDYLMSRLDIIDCINRIARGVDRLDRDIFRSGYHDDAILDFGTHIGSPEQHMDFFFDLHARAQTRTAHTICNHTCEIDGDTAHAESYVIGLFLNPDGISARLLAGRYIDRLERRDGEWRIALRRCTSEVMFSGDASVGNSEYFRNMDFLRGLRSPSDVSYQRPLLLDQTPAGHRWPRTMED